MPSIQRFNLRAFIKAHVVISHVEHIRVGLFKTPGKDKYIIQFN